MARLQSTVVPSRVATPRTASLLDDRRLAAVLALTLALAAGLGSSAVAQRGPTTTTSGLLVMAIALVLGVAGGSLARTRWILAPLAVAYVAGVELGRIDVVGPSLDIRLDNTYGIIAFLLTRGVHGLLALLPMTFGVLAGIGVARYLGWLAPGDRSWVPLGSATVALAVVGLAILVAWPASTPPILGTDGQPIPGSINELTTVRLGGTDQAVMIRAADPSKPVLLYLSGGPGQSDLALARALSTGWVNDFVFVDLDQRGNGKSYPAIDPALSLTLEQAVADVIELTDYLRSRFDEQKVYLMGESWGTILGVLAVRERPDLYHAWIGSGQMVDVADTDMRIYLELVEYATQAGDTALLAELHRIDSPPYRDIPWANSNLLAWYGYLYEPYTPSAGYVARGEAAGLDPFGVLGSEYNVIEKTTVLRGLIDTFALLYPQLYGLDLRESASRLEVPVYILDGLAEVDGRRDPMLEWYELLEAPTKVLVPFEGAAHSVAFEQADEVQRLLNETIVPTTYGR